MKLPVQEMHSISLHSAGLESRNLATNKAGFRSQAKLAAPLSFAQRLRDTRKSLRDFLYRKSKGFSSTKKSRTKYCRYGTIWYSAGLESRNLATNKAGFLRDIPVQIRVAA